MTSRRRTSAPRPQQPETAARTAGPPTAAAPLIIDIQVMPRASRPLVGGRVGDRLRVAVSAPPVDGAANAAVAEALARAFGVRTRDVSIVRGETGRRKTVQVRGGSPAILRQLLGDDSGRSDHA